MNDRLTLDSPIRLLILAIEHTWCQVLEDMADETVPDVSSFSDLHDSVDANEYGMSYHNANVELANLIQDAIDERLRRWMHHVDGELNAVRVLTQSRELLQRWDAGGNVELAR